MTEQYLKRPVTSTELRVLANLAAEEEEAFFRRNPHLVRPYKKRLLLIALCQGAALQYLGCGYGVKDFDVHFFYAQDPEKPKLSRAVKRIRSSVGSFPNVPIDFIRTVIPYAAPRSESSSIVEIVREFLRTRPTPNARHLAKKAVIGLSPKDLYASQIWPSA